MDTTLENWDLIGKNMVHFLLVLRMVMMIFILIIIIIITIIIVIIIIICRLPWANQWIAEIPTNIERTSNCSYSGTRQAMEGF